MAIQMNFDVEDVEFAKLMARWVTQSEYKFGKSGGSTNCDTDSLAKMSPLASFRPFDSATYFKRFPKLWTKQKHFKHAEPLLGIVFTAMSHKYGRDWMVYGNSAINWYRFGCNDFVIMRPKIQAIMGRLARESRQKKIVLYGRDCLPFYRVLRYFVDNLKYVEGVSRAVCQLNSFISVHHPSKLTEKVSNLQEYIAKSIGKFDPEKLLHVDTGFSGTIPKHCIAALKGTFEEEKDSEKVWMMSSAIPKWNMNFGREFVTKLESRPKFFFRPSKWIVNPLLDKSSAKDSFDISAQYAVSNETTKKDNKTDFFDPFYAQPTTGVTTSNFGSDTLTFNLTSSSTSTTMFTSIHDQVDKMVKIPFKKLSKPEADSKLWKWNTSSDENEPRFIPELKVTGDAINAAAYIIGIMSAAKELKI